MSLPIIYIEDSHGNFGQYKVDGNMFRWLTVYFAVGVCLVTLLFRAIYYILKYCSKCHSKHR